ncbi:MAG: carboxypeptidase-like regulatory domain-containing protein [Planctomycetota bacterium]|jgi:hypothetical protein
MNIVRFSLSLPLLLACIALGSGCGSGPNLADGATGTVNGKVTLEGQPVPEGTTVMFQRDSDGQVATGICDADGEFLLRMKGGLEIVEGTYRVAVMPPNPTANMSDEEAMQASVDGKLEDVAAVSELIPEKYQVIENSKTIFSVKPGSNEFTLDMKK